METLEDLDRERGQAKPSKRAKRRSILQRQLTIRVLLALAPLLAKLVQLGVEIIRALR
jgi:hypothetical protein